MNVENVVIVLGLQPQGLFLVKSIKPFCSRIIGFSNTKAVGYYSRSIDPIIVTSGTMLKQKLRELFEFYGKVKVFITSGTFLDFIINEFPESKELFDIQIPEISVLKRFLDKRETYKICETLGIKYPKVLDIGSEKIDVGTQVIAKWSREDSIFEKRPFKTKKLSGSKAIQEFRDSNCKLIKDGSIILQQLIDLTEFSSVSYLGYYKDGKCKGGMGVKQLRQFPLGITSALIALDLEKEKKLKNIASRLILEKEYQGFAEVEFLADEAFNEIYLIEVNPRLCGWSSALDAKFDNIGAFLMGHEKYLVQNNSVKDGGLFYWVNAIRDTFALIKMFRQNKSFTLFMKGIKNIFTADIQDSIYNDEKMLLLKYYMGIRTKLF